MARALIPNSQCLGLETSSRCRTNCRRDDRATKRRMPVVGALQSVTCFAQQSVSSPLCTRRADKLQAGRRKRLRGHVCAVLTVHAVQNKELDMTHRHDDCYCVAYVDAPLSLLRVRSQGQSPDDHPMGQRGQSSSLWVRRVLIYKLRGRLNGWPSVPWCR
jgi:hypothetical protein